MESLFQSPPIIENIFKHLSARDLSVCAQVCKLWTSMSVVELNQRRDICFFFQTAEKDNESALERYGFEEELEKQLKSLRIKTSTCICFASQSLIVSSKDFFPSLLPIKPKTKKQKTYYRDLVIARLSGQSVLKSVLAPHLPSQTKCMFAVGPGVVGYCSDNTSLEVEDGFTITGFCLPEMAGLEIQSYDYLRFNMEDVLSEERKAKCLLVFDSCSSTSHPNLYKIIHQRVKKNPNIAIGGATLGQINKIIVISGENVEAASLIIRKQDSKEELKNKLKLFEETGLLKNRCFAFMFACVARGYDFHKEPNFESKTFHSLYPKVPLIGLFGEGEIGVNYLPLNGATSSKKFPDTKKYFYSYSTVFVLVSIKE